MGRLVNADEVYKVLTNYYHHRTEIQHKALKEAIERVPTVDIDAITESHERTGYDRGFRDGYAQATSEVKHGEWRYDEALELEWCSECGFGKRKGDKRWYSYCPNCGAKMEAENVRESD